MCARELMRARQAMLKHTFRISRRSTANMNLNHFLLFICCLCDFFAAFFPATARKNQVKMRIRDKSAPVASAVESVVLVAVACEIIETSA